MTEQYIFKLREDMPRGFIENERIPELPAAYKFLQLHAGRMYESREEFQREMDGFVDYLQKNNIPRGMDRDVREGIFLFDDNTVGTRNDSPSDRCAFGRLEWKALGN